MARRQGLSRNFPPAACPMALGSAFLCHPRHARAVAGGLSATLLNLRAGVAAVYNSAERSPPDEITETGAGGDVMALPQILLVEDESIVALDLTRRLTRWGYAVTRVASGAAAVDAADTLRPGLVLMDVRLPGSVDGLQAAAIWARRPVPIVYLTGSADPALLDGVQTPPPVFTLAKPFSEATLQDIIGQAVVAWPDKPPP
jgi:CheY-like chemotaxis protein